MPDTIIDDTVIWKGKRYSCKKFAKLVEAKWNNEIVFDKDSKKTKGVTSIGCSIVIKDYNYDMPDLTSVKCLRIEGYEHSFPVLAFIQDDLIIDDYNKDFPCLKSVNGSFSISDCSSSFKSLTEVSYVEKITGECSFPELKKVTYSIHLTSDSPELPKLKTVEGTIDIRGYKYSLKKLRSFEGIRIDDYDKKIKNVIVGTKDQRGYLFIAYKAKDKWRIKAGCRDFSTDQAIEHWKVTKDCDATRKRINKECSAIVKSLINLINERNRKKEGKKES